MVINCQKRDCPGLGSDNSVWVVLRRIIFRATVATKCDFSGDAQNNCFCKTHPPNPRLYIPRNSVTSNINTYWSTLFLSYQQPAS